MKLVVGNFAVEVKAKNTEYSERNNVVDAFSFLNMASIAFDKAAEVYKANNRPFIAEDFEKMSNDIYAALKAAGAYKDI